jgi:hypothetical protein
MWWMREGIYWAVTMTSDALNFGTKLLGQLWGRLLTCHEVPLHMLHQSEAIIITGPIRTMSLTQGLLR